MKIKKTTAFWRFLLILLPLATFPQAGFSQTSDPTVKFRLATALEQANDFEHALKLYQELETKDSTNTVYADAVQRLLIQLKRYDEVVAFMNNRLKRTPQDPGLLVTLGTVYYRAGKENDAYTTWQRVIDLSPKNPNVYRLVASAELENRLLDRAVGTYRKGREAVGDPTMFNLELAQLLVATMDYAGATAEYLGWLAHNPSQVAFVENRLSAFTAKPDGRAQAITTVLQAIHEKSDQGLYEILGWLYIEGKEWEKAYDAYTEIDKLVGANGAGLTALADRALNEHEYPIAVRAYKAALAENLSDQRRPLVMYGYASALKELALGKDTSAVREDRISSRVTEVPSSDAAVNAYQDLITRYPHHQLAALAYFSIGLLRMERDEDLDAAKISFERARDDPAGPPVLKFEAALRLGDLATWRGDTATARKMYLWVSSRQDATPDQSDEGTFRVAELDYFGGNFPSAQSLLNTMSLNVKADFANDALALKAFLQENIGTPDALRAFARADLTARQHRNSEAIQMFRDVIERFPQSQLVDDALMKMAGIQAQGGQYNDAVATYQTLLDKFKKSSIDLDRAQFLMGDVYQSGLHNVTAAIAAYEQLLATYPKSLMADEARRRIRLLRGEVQ
ncbi:MAG: tetratricopeptide repeat protein [Bacteroidota bacterium]